MWRVCSETSLLHCCMTGCWPLPAVSPSTCWGSCCCTHLTETPPVTVSKLDSSQPTEPLESRTHFARNARLKPLGALRTKPTQCNPHTLQEGCHTNSKSLGMRTTSNR